VVLRKTSMRIALIIILIAGTALADDQAELDSLLNKHTYAISLEGLSLTGPGAELIQDLSQGTQFVALGEEHNNVHIPGIATAIFKDLN